MMLPRQSILFYASCGVYLDCSEKGRKEGGLGFLLALFDVRAVAMDLVPGEWRLRLDYIC